MKSLSPIAFLAIIFSCIQLLPQVYHSFRTEQVGDLSGWTIALLLFTNLLWFIHGYHVNDFALVVSGIINIFLCSLLLFALWKYSDTTRELLMSIRSE